MQRNPPELNDPSLSLSVSRFFLRAVLLLSLIAPSLASDLTARGTPSSNLGETLPVDDRIYDTVKLGTTEKSACSPTKPGRPWLGIIIQGPTRIVVPRSTALHRMPLCGYFRLAADKLFYSQRPMIVSAKNVHSGRVYTGEAVEPEDHLSIPPPPMAPPKPEDLAHLVLSEYFNMNIVSYVPIPSRAATYDVSVEFGPTRSNTVRIQIAVQK